MKQEKDGVIYILTNPSFPEYVKIGYATNVQERLRSLNRSECMDFFEINVEKFSNFRWFFSKPLAS